MSDLDASYVENRAAQNLSNMGELENAAPNMKFEQTAIEQVDGEFQKVGRNPDQGVAAVVGNYNKQDKTSGATYLDHGAALDKAARTGVTNVREDGEYWVGDEEGVGQVIIDKVAGKGSGETLNPSDISTIEQFQEALKNGDGTEVRNADLTFKEKGQGIITKFLSENFNIDEQKAFGHALRIMGTTSDDPRAAELGLGLIDLTPLAAITDTQEGIRLYQQGKATDSATDQVIGGVVTFLGALSVIPAASTVTKAAKKLFNSGKADEAMSVIQQFIVDESGALKPGALSDSLGLTEPGQKQFGDLADINADLSSDGKHINLNNVSSISNGGSKQALDTLHTEADRIGATVGVIPKPIPAKDGIKGKTLSQLKKMYKSMGYKPQEGSDQWIRQPKEKQNKLFHGTTSGDQIRKGKFDTERPLFVSRNRLDAKTYADVKSTDPSFGGGPDVIGEVLEFNAPKKIANRSVVLKTAKDLNIDYQDEFELLDTDLGNNADKIISKLKSDGYDAAEINDFLPVTGEKIKSIAIFDPKKLSAVAPLAALDGEQTNETFDRSQDVQVASAANKFLQEVVGRTAASKVISKEARIAQDLISGNYKNFVDDVPVKGTDFNFERMDTSDELKNQINAVSFVYEDTIDAAKKGVVPHDVTKDLAELLGQDMDAAEAAVKSLPGDVEDLHVRALTMRKLLVGSAQKTDELARKIQAGGPDVSDGDYLRFREQIVRHSQLQAQMKGVQTEIGRALSSFRIPSAAYERNPQIAEELINQIGGKETSREMAERWLTTPIDRRADFAARSAFARTKDAVYEVWINGLLSGLRTHQVNTVGNTVFTMFQIPERVLAAGVGSVFRNPDRVRFREAYAMARGSAEGVVDGIKLAWKTWKDEMPQDGISKIEAQQMKAITPENFNVNPDSLGGKAIDYIGQGVRLPGRALMTADEFYKAVGYRSELRAVSMRKMLQARDEGLVSDLITDISQTAKAEDAQRLTELRKTSDERNLNGDELSELMDIMIENPTKEIDMAAHDYATYITFQSELGEAGKAIQSAASRIPGGRVIIPFIRTPTNIIKEFARRSPLAAAMPSTYKALQAGGPARDLAIARIGVGTSLMTWAYFLATDGKITGGGPSKKSGTYAQWRETHEPYSMKIDGKWYPYGRIEPLAMLFGSTADAVDFIQYSSDQDAADKVYIAAFTGVMQNIGSKTFLRGISDVSDAFTDPARYGESYVANMARTTIPFSSMTRDITRANDPVMRETRAFGTSNDDNPINVGLQRILNEMKASTPGFSNDLPPKRTFWGKERYAYEGGPATSFYAFSSKGVKHSPIDDEMVRLNTPLNMPSKRVGQYELNPQQYDRLVVLMNKTPEGMNSIDLVLKYGNKTMRSAMNNLVQSELWKQVQSDDVKIHYLKSIRNDYIDAAKQALSLEDSAIGDAKLQEDTDKMLLESEKGFIKPLIGTSTQIGVN